MVKGATLLFDMFCSNAVKLVVARFIVPSVWLYLQVFALLVSFTTYSHWDIKNSTYQSFLIYKMTKR